MISLLLTRLHLIHLCASITVVNHHACLLGEGLVAFHRRSIISAVGRERWESEQVRPEADAKKTLGP